MECWIILAVIVGIVLLVQSASASARQKAKQAYEQALNDLKQDPNNAQKRQMALLLGRNYSNLTRNGQGVTIYDEAAIKNDLDAATAGAAKVTGSEPSMPKRNAEDRLAQLENLRQKGLISEDEYQVRRNDILSDL